VNLSALARYLRQRWEALFFAAIWAFLTFQVVSLIYDYKELRGTEPPGRTVYRTEFIHRQRLWPLLRGNQLPTSYSELHQRA